MVELDQFKYTLSTYDETLKEVKDSLDLENKERRITELDKSMEEPGFWDDPERSTKTVREAKNLKDTVDGYKHLEQQYEDIQVMIEMGYEENDPAMIPEIQEMLDEFSFMGEDIAKEVVISNPNKINAMIDEGVQPVQDESFPPKIPHTAERVRKLTYDKAHELYGDPLPDNIQARLDRELDAIIGNGYGVVYLISQMLVAKSVKDGYLVGSRGSVGSSLVATMMGITEINPMPPHYRCPKCKQSEFFENGEYASGFDLPDKKCPDCQVMMVKDGQNIPFETFLGFHGDKVPDIDLNFSGDYQPVAHNFIRVMFGPNHSFKAGTVGTLADKKAIGYAKHYQDEHPEIKMNNAEVDRLAIGVTGVKATTGQHPAGIIIVPDDMEIYDYQLPLATYPPRQPSLYF